MMPDKSAGRPDRATHADLAAYALGVLNESEAAAFEAHLDKCTQCRQELESMTPVADTLSYMDMSPHARVVGRHREAGGGWISKVLSRLRLHRPTRTQSATIATRDLHDEAYRFELQAARFTGDLAATLRRFAGTDRKLP